MREIVKLVGDLAREPVFRQLMPVGRLDIVARAARCRAAAMRRLVGALLPIRRIGLLDHVLDGQVRIHDRPGIAQEHRA